MNTMRNYEKAMLISFTWRKLLLGALLAVGIASSSETAQAQLTGFVNNPSGNSVDWTNSVIAAGATINTNVNFDTHPNGPLQPNFYQASSGVALSVVNYSTVETGPGTPSGTNDGIPGEGTYSGGTYLTNLFDRPGSILRVSFQNPVSAVGFYIIDLYNPGGINPTTIEAFTGPDGTGTSLGQFSAVPENFQLNHIYFMGLADTMNSINSVVFSTPGNSGDTVEIDAISFASFASVPEPTVLSLSLIVSLLTVGCVWRRRRLLS